MQRLSIYEIKNIILCLLRPKDSQDLKWENFNGGPLNSRGNNATKLNNIQIFMYNYVTKYKNTQKNIPYENK